jgi:hypothetical protein
MKVMSSPSAVEEFSPAPVDAWHFDQIDCAPP